MAFKPYCRVCASWHYPTERHSPYRWPQQPSPGPWFMGEENESRARVLCEDEMIADCSGRKAPANARAIAALPDLLAACKALSRWSEDDEALTKIIAEARAAVVKAEGREP